MQQSTALEIMKSGKNVFLSGQAGCYDKATEYLTPKGWKKFSDYVNGEFVAQFNALTEEVTFVLPQDYIKLPCDKLTRVVTDSIDMCLSDEHKVLFYTEGSSVPFRAEYSSYLRMNSNKSYPSTYIKTNFKYKSGVGSSTSNSDLISTLNTILKLSTIIDPGSMYQTYNEEQLILLSDYLFSKYIEEGEELVLSKGNYKDKVDFVQFVLTAGGNSSTFTTSIKGDDCVIKFTSVDSYSVVNYTNCKPKEYKPTDGYKYCFTVDTGFLLVRRNNKIFISGNSGKSYTLNKFIEHLRINNIPAGITASTGIASTLVNGSTIHAFANIGIKDTLTASDIHQIRMRKPIADRIRSVKVLIIDEISMLHFKQFEMVDYVFKSIRNDFRPFGGVQIIVAGDFCLKVGTRIIMADGTLRNIEDIIIGDYVMGPDGKPREVLKLFKGTAPLYEVSQTNGMTYTTTGNHLLALKRRGKSKRYPKISNHINMKITDFIKTSDKFKEVFGGYKSNTIQYKGSELTLDPYFLGLWLGDGERGAVRISNPDQEVISWLEEYSKSLNLNCLIVPERDDTDCKRISISSEQGKNNPLRDSLRAYGVLTDKYIPDDFLYSSVDDRLKLLAGIIDSDGSCSSNRFIISTSIPKLKDNIIILANQLGFRVSCRSFMPNGYPTTTISYAISLGGDLWRIPTKILRKQIYEHRLGGDHLASTLSVKQVGSGEFAGIEVDGDNLFLLEDCTVLHNCQLPPVGNEDIAKRFAFMSRAWVQAEFQACYLTEQHRQTVSELNHIINSIRNNTVDDSVYSILDSRIVNSKTIEDDHSTKLFTHNMSVDSFNNKKLDQLDGEERLYKAKTTGTEANIKSLITNILSPPELILKIGSRVMFTKNDASGDYVNGTIGTIEKLSAKHVVVRTLDGKQLHVESQEWAKEDMYGSVIATYTQLPLKLSWAVTIHKCIHPDTLVNTIKDGWIPIKDIEPEGNILTDRKTYNKYSNKISNPVRDGIEIETKYGFKVSVTTDHECKVECAYAPYTYIEAKDLVIDDRLLMLNSVFDYKIFDILPVYRLSNPAYYTLMQYIKAQLLIHSNLNHVPRDIIPPSSLQEIQLMALSNGILLDLSNPNSLNIPYSFILSNNPLFLNITSLKPIQLESMCVTVDETGSFIQNGFDMSNCQGMTLDAAVIDLRSTFEYGQGYVALSRLKDIEGLQLLGYNPTALELHPLARKADARFKELSTQLEEEFLS